MRKILLDAAQRLMGQGITPSVAELAEHAQVSRATAYRYFPSQSALIAAVVDESLGPILAWESSADDAARASTSCCASPTRAWRRTRRRCAPPSGLAATTRRGQRRPHAGNEPRLVRGHRVDILKRAIAPLAGALTPAQQERVAQALSLVYGTEVFLVLKDIWRLDLPEVTGWRAGPLRPSSGRHWRTPGLRRRARRTSPRRRQEQRQARRLGRPGPPPAARRRHVPASGARRRQPVIPTSPAAGIVRLRGAASCGPP